MINFSIKRIQIKWNDWRKSDVTLMITQCIRIVITDRNSFFLFSKITVFKCLAHFDVTCKYNDKSFWASADKMWKLHLARYNWRQLLLALWSETILCLREMCDQDRPLCELNEFKAFLAKCLNRNILSYKLRPLTKPGDNYGSIMQSVDVEVAGGGLNNVN